MTGTVYVANFSWYFTPMWEVAKRTFSQKALKIITFVNESELKDCVPEENLPKGTNTNVLYIKFRPWRNIRLCIRLQEERRITTSCQPSPDPRQNNISQKLLRLDIRSLLFSPLNTESPSNNSTNPFLSLIKSLSMASKLGISSRFQRPS